MGGREKRKEEGEGKRRWEGKRRAVAEVSNSMYGRSGGHVAVVCALFMYTPVTLVAPSTSFVVHSVACTLQSQVTFFVVVVVS